MSTPDAATSAPAASVEARLKRLAYTGALTEANATARGGTLVATEHGAASSSDHVRLYLIVDGSGTVRDARFVSEAHGALLAAYDAMCELVVGRPMTEAATVSPKQVDVLLAGSPDGGAIPLAADADQPFYVLRKAAERWSARPAAAGDQKPFASCGLFEKVKRIEAVLDAHVRPALASDGGGLDLVDLKNDDLFVEYQGACGSCSSSVGGTLQFVTDSLNNHLGASLTVHVSSLNGGDESPFSLH